MQGNAGEDTAADPAVLVAEILAILKLGPRGGDSSAAHQLTITLAQQHSEAIAELTAGCLRQAIDGGVILDAALSFLPMTRWAELVALAVDAVGHDSDSEAAQSVLDYAGLQHPAAVHPFLTHLFAAGYFAGYRDTTVFREAPLEAVLFLFGALWSGNPWATRLVAAALLETRLPEALAFVQHVLPEELALLLPSVGFEVAGTQFRQLYPDCVLHLAFATTYLPRRRELAPHDWGRIHPTWVWGREVEKPHRVGGTVLPRAISISFATPVAVAM